MFLFLMNLVETLSAHVTEQAEDIGRLRDEMRWLEVGQGKPNLRVAHSGVHQHEPGVSACVGALLLREASASRSSHVGVQQVAVAVRACISAA